MNKRFIDGVGEIHLGRVAQFQVDTRAENEDDYEFGTWDVIFATNEVDGYNSIVYSSAFEDGEGLPLLKAHSDGGDILGVGTVYHNNDGLAGARGYFLDTEAAQDARTALIALNDVGRGTVSIGMSWEGLEIRHGDDLTDEERELGVYYVIDKGASRRSIINKLSSRTRDQRCGAKSGQCNRKRRNGWQGQAISAII